MRRAAKIDANQTEIVKTFRRLGATVLITAQLKNAFDLLVGHAGNLYIVEVKDGSKTPSQRKLSDGELKCKQNFELVGVKYHVIKSVEEAIELINSKP